METIQKTTEMNWYVVRAAGNKERAVADKLRKEGEQGDLMGILGDVVVPIDKKITVVKGNKTTRDVVVYPGYIFVQTNAVGELKYHLRGMPGVSGFLTERNGKIQHLSKSEVSYMLSKYEEMKEKENTIDDIFVEGQNVKILDGPFKDFVGTVSDVKNEKISVNVSIFGRITPVELDSKQISKDL